MKRIFSLAICIFTSVMAADCQDLLIRYDVVNKDIRYYKIKKRKNEEKLVQMKNPRIGPNRNVRVEYVNMNPFVWNQPKVNLVSVAKDSISSFNPFTMMLPSNIADKFGSMGFSFTRDASAMNPQQQMCLASLSSLYKAYDDISNLKYDYKLTKQEIMEKSDEKIRDVMRTCNLPIAEKNDTGDVSRSDFQALRTYFHDVCKMEIPGLTRSASDAKMDAFLGNSGMDASSKVVLPTEALSSIENNYFTVSNTDFTSENSFIVGEKDLVVHMDFSLTDEYVKKTGKDTAKVIGSGAKSTKVKDQSIFVPVAGAVRVSSSAGIGFTYLGGNRHTYYLEGDTVLASSPDNRVVPVVGTFLNVYSRGMGAINLGGSFGIFASLQETLAINYLIGMTATIGRQERVLITAGCAMSPVDEPSKGYYVGMHTTNPDFPTALTYKPGFFFCIHYNVGKF